MRSLYSGSLFLSTLLMPLQLAKTQTVNKIRTSFIKRWAKLTDSPVYFLVFNLASLNNNCLNHARRSCKSVIKKMARQTFRVKVF